jgi:hypothetical protein
VLCTALHLDMPLWVEDKKFVGTLQGLSACLKSHAFVAQPHAVKGRVGSCAPSCHRLCLLDRLGPYSRQYLIQPQQSESAGQQRRADYFEALVASQYA